MSKQANDHGLIPDLILRSAAGASRRMGTSTESDPQPSRRRFAPPQVEVVAVRPPQDEVRRYAAMLATTCAKSCSRRAGERRRFNRSENVASLPFSKAATTV